MPRSLPFLAAFLLAPGEVGVIGNLQRLGEHALEIAAVIGDAGGGRERQLRRLDEIALAQGQPVDAHLVGGAVDQPLHVVIGLGPAGAAIGAHQRGVGQHRLDVDAEQRRAVDAGEVLAGVERQRARRDAGDVGAEIAVAVEAHGEELAFGIERQFGVHDLRAAVAVGQEAGRALVGPLHRAAEHLRRMQDADIFGIVHVLHAERAADIGGQDANLVVRHVQDFCER